MQILDKGFVELKSSMGTDLTVVNSARVSYGGESSTLSEKDEKLIKYLATHEHTSPFRHCFMTFHVKAPEFVARQWYKHIIGCNFSLGDAASHGWNEISGRYVEYEPDFYIPDQLRAQSKSSKQASVESSSMPSPKIIEDTTAVCNRVYRDLIKAGVAKEQARLVLPFSTYTEFYWTASLQAVAHFCKLRNHEHAQYEIKEYAEALELLAKHRFPESFKALMSNEEV